MRKHWRKMAAKHWQDKCLPVWECSPCSCKTWPGNQKATLKGPGYVHEVQVDTWELGTSWIPWIKTNRKLRNNLMPEKVKNSQGKEEISPREAELTWDFFFLKKIKENKKHQHLLAVWGRRQINSIYWLPKVLVSYALLWLNDIKTFWFLPKLEPLSPMLNSLCCTYFSLLFKTGWPSLVDS